MNNNQTQDQVSDSNPTLDQRFGQVYMNALNYLEARAQAKLPGGNGDPSANEVAVDVIQDLLTLLNGISLYGAALYQLIQFEAKPEHVERLNILKAGVLNQFVSETRFCATVENMARDQKLKEAGIDPADKAAVEKFYLDQAQNIFFSAPTVTNETKQE